MKQICKICKVQLDATSEFVQHFDFNHRVTTKSLFICGVENCSVRFSQRKRYEVHLLDFHSQLHSYSNVSEEKRLPPNSADCTAELDSTHQYKCPHLGCIYTCNSKTTLRVHRFRKHPAAPGISTASSALREEVPEASNDIAFPSLATATNDASSDLTVGGGEIPYPTNEAPKEPYESLKDSADVQAKRDSIRKRFLHLYLALSSKHHVPEPVLQYIVETYEFLIKESTLLIKNEIESNVAQAGLSYESPLKNIVESALSNNVAEEVHSFEGPLRSAYIRNQSFRNVFQFVPSRSHALGLDDHNIMRKYHTVPLRRSLEVFLNDESVYLQYEETQRRMACLHSLQDIHDGSLFNRLRNLYDSSTVMLMIYSDDLELFNPLGCAKTVHKVTNIYVSVANLMPWSRTKRTSILLALTCREHDVAYFGLKKVLEPFIKDLKDLEEHGIDIKGTVRKVAVLMLLGDNLGTHTITGFLENFSRAKYFCRFCEESRVEWQKRWYGMDSIDSHSEANDEDEESEDDCSDMSDDSDVASNVDLEGNTPESNYVQMDIDLSHIPEAARLRTTVSYDECVQHLTENPALGNVKGVVAKCAFNELNSFHCVGRSPPCIAHDIFEGIIPHDVSLALRYLAEVFQVDAKQINRKVSSFKFLGVDKLDKPPQLSVKHFKICGNAVQNWVFLRFLPLFIADRITDKSNSVWKMILLLRRIVQRISSPVIGKASLLELKNEIRCYLYLRTTLFPASPLRPKHHYFEHYPELIEIFGPLMRVSTLNFESKHPFFKNTIRSKRCCKNITKTLTEEHQLMMSSLSGTQLVENFPVLKNAYSLEDTAISEEIRRVVITFFGEAALASVAFSDCVTFRGTKYTKGCIVVVSSQKCDDVEVCRVGTICVRGEQCYIAGYLGRAVYNASLGVHNISGASTQTAIKVLSLSLISDYSAYQVYALGNLEFVVLKHLQ